MLYTPEYSGCPEFLESPYSSTFDSSTNPYFTEDENPYTSFGDSFNTSAENMHKNQYMNCEQQEIPPIVSPTSTENTNQESVNLERITEEISAIGAEMRRYGLIIARDVARVSEDITHSVRREIRRNVLRNIRSMSNNHH